jgi:hypothetical protein
MLIPKHGEDKDEEKKEERYSRHHLAVKIRGNRQAEKEL